MSIESNRRVGLRAVCLVAMRVQGVRVLLFLNCLLFLAATPARPLADATTIDRAYEGADIVCIAEGLASVPAPEPTIDQQRTTATYLARVTHVWKGAPTDTLVLFAGHGREYDPEGRDARWFVGCGGPGRVEPGNRYVLFAWIGSDGNARVAGHTRIASGDCAELLWLSRNVGAPRPTVHDAADIPDASLLRMAFELERGDSITGPRAARSLMEFSDSAGVIVPRLSRLLMSPEPRWRRMDACQVLGTWSDHDRAARLAVLRALDRGDKQAKLAVISWSTHRRRDMELQWRVFDHRENPDPEVRAAVLEHTSGLATSPYPPIRAYRDALRDPSAEVRMHALLALERSRTDDGDVARAVQDCLDDPDRHVSRIANRFAVSLAKRRP